MEQPKSGRTAPANAKQPNPAKAFISWKSKEKAFVYYNKEKQEDVKMPTPFTFIPLAKAITLKGYNQKREKSYISNEVPDITTDQFVVKSYHTKIKQAATIEYKGFYKDFSKQMDDSIKYTESIYAAVKNKQGELSIVNIQLNGAGLTHWFEFVKKNNIWAGAVSFTGKTTAEKNGAVDYLAPIFELAGISPEDDAKAGVLQAEINDYLEKYYADNRASLGSAVVGSQVANNTEASQQRGSQPAASSTPETTNDEPIVNYGSDDDDSLPF